MYKLSNNIILAFCILGCIFTMPLWGQFQYENQIVEQIDIIINAPTNAQCETSQVTSKIKTRKGDHFSQVEFDNDLKNLSREFDRVEPSFSSENGRMFITLKVWPKPTIRTITWTGNEKVSIRKLHKELGLKSCAIFDRQEFNQAFHKLKTYYVKQGFFEASLDYTVIPDPLTNEVDITIDIVEGRCGRIKHIIFNNFTAKEEEDLTELMLTKRYNFFMSWMTNEGTYNEEMIQQDRFAILNYLHNAGYADAHVDINVTECAQDNRIIIMIDADKGPIYMFGDVTFNGNKIFPDEAICNLLTIYKGLPFSPEKIRDTQNDIKNFYGRRGYIDAFADFEAKLNNETCTYDVNFIIEEGEQFRVGLIKVFGNSCTQTNVILHETLLVPGEIFNLEKMTKTEERLTNVGYFSSVNVYAVESQECSDLGGNFRDVHIEVEETTTGSFGAFFGISTVENLFGGLHITENNFNSAGLPCFRRTGFAGLRGGGEYLELSAEVGTKSRSYSLSWAKPHFMDSKWSVGFRLEKTSNRYIAKDYDIDAAGFTLNATYDVNAYLKAQWHYRIRNSIVHVREKTPTEEQKKEKEEHPNRPFLYEAAKYDGIVSATGVSLIYDSTDSMARPTTGFKSRLDLEFAGLGGPYKFLGFGYLNSYYEPIGSKGVLKIRFDWRFVVPYFGQNKNHIPQDERIFLGADNMIRGFRPYKLGPRFIEDDARGGLSMQIYSIEYSRKISSRIDGFIFFDAGSLSGKVLHLGRLFAAPGFGARIQVFEKGPPFTVGMGFPLSWTHKGQVKKFFFSVGGRF